MESPETQDRWRPRPRRVVAVLGLGLLLLAAPINRISRDHTNYVTTGVTLGLVLVILCLFVHLGLAGRFENRRPPLFWLEQAVFYLLAVALVLYAGPEWIPVLTLVAAISGLRCDRRVATALATGCAATALVLARSYDEPLGQTAIIILLTVVMALFSYGSGQRVQTINTLQETRRHLAQLAVQEERLRFARDLHDLLGHSLSVIIVKAELAERVLRADPAYAERELAEVQGVARRSLSEVRQAVNGYRQPSLRSEIADARRALDAAEITCRVDVPEDLSLPSGVEGVLAWAVREGTTNVVRHSGASGCAIRVTAGDEEVGLTIDDDGTPPAGDGPGSEVAVTYGAGLAGLSERAAAKGGEVRVGRAPALDGSPGGGLRLSVTLPRDGSGGPNRMRPEGT